MRSGMTAQLAGVVVLSVLLFIKIPIVMTLSLGGGALLIAVGFAAWLWGLIWGRP